jgi:hypothetical protein
MLNPGEIATAPLKNQPLDRQDDEWLLWVGSDRRILESGRSRNPAAEWPVSAALLSESAEGSLSAMAESGSSGRTTSETAPTE